MLSVLDKAKLDANKKTENKQKYISVVGRHV